ncbi:AAA family ATPase [bacterium]|nr:AAA family ATPase [bacterium]
MAPVVFAFLNQKGGVGKTTLALHVAHAHARKRQRVLLVDADPQGSALDWAESRTSEAPFPVVGLPKASLHKELPQLGRDYHTIIIDGSPRVYDVARSAILASHVVLIPVQPSPYDVWASHEIVDLIDEARIYKPDLKAAFVINRRIMNTALGRDVKSALADYPIPVLKSAVSQRIIFAESAASGQTVFEIAPKHAAAQEIQSLVKEIQGLIP